MAVENYHLGFGFKLFFQVIKKDVVDLATLVPQSGLGASKFIDNTTLMPNTNRVVQYGTGTDFKLFSGVPKAITNVEAATGTATLTFAAAHGIANSSVIVVEGLTGTAAPLNGVKTVTAVTTSTPFTLTFAHAGSITSAAVTAGTAMSGALKLDGTDAPVRLLGLQNCSPNEGENTDSLVVYDDEAAGYDKSASTSQSMSWSVAGQTNFSDAAYWLMRFGSKHKVDQGLMLKYARSGPQGVNQVCYGYGRFPSFEEPSEAGSVIKYNSSIAGYGPYQIEK